MRGVVRRGDAPVRLRAAALTALALVGLAYAFLHVALQPGRSFAVYSDNEALLGPILSLISRMIAAGEWPLRTDTFLGGFPLYNFTQLSAFYPFYFTALPIFGAPGETMHSMHWLVLGHMVLLEITTYVFLRAAGTSRPAAIAGAALIAFSANAFQYAVWINITAPYAWLPLYLAGVVGMLESPGSGRAAITALAGIVLLTLASPAQPLIHAVYVTLVFVVVYAVRAGRAGRPRVRASVGSIAAIALVAVLLCAPVLLPAVVDFPSMKRWIGPFPPIRGSQRIPFEAFYFDQLSFADLGGVLYRFTGPVVGDPYVGVVTVALAAIGIACGYRAWIVAAMTFIAAYALLSATGRHSGLAYLNYYLPLLSKVREAGRFFVLFQFAMGTLAAFGIDALARTVLDGADRARARRALLTLAIVAAVASVVLALQFDRVADPARAKLSLAVLVALVVATILAARYRFRGRTILVQATWCAAALALLAVQVAPQVPEIAGSQYVTMRMADLDAAIARVAARDPSREYRLLFDGSIEKQTAAMLASYRGVRTLNAYINPAPSRQFDELYYHAAQPGNYFRVLGARYLICRACGPEAVRDYRRVESVAGYEIYEADEALPRWYVVTRKDGEFSDLADFKGRAAGVALAQRHPLHQARSAARPRGDARATQPQPARRASSRARIPASASRSRVRSTPCSC